MTLQLFGASRLSIVKDSLRTLSHRREFCKFHFQAATTLMDDGIKGLDDSEVAAAMLGGRDSQDWQFQSARFQAYAHIVACVHSLHAVGDNIAYLIYFALGMDLDGRSRLRKEKDICPDSVMKRLTFGAVKQALEEFFNDRGYVYVRALSNHSKHRSLIDLPYRMDFVSAPATHGLVFDRFSYDGVSYDLKWAVPTLRDEFNRQERVIGRLGAAINDNLRSRL